MRAVTENLLRMRLVSLVVASALIAVACASSVEPNALDTSTGQTSLVPIGEATAPQETTAPETTGPEVTVPETTVPTQGAEVYSSYALAPGLLDLDGDTHPVQVQGVIGVPEGAGPFPVAIVMHGSHPICRDDFVADAFTNGAVTVEAPAFCPTGFPDYSRSDVGLAYVVESLNRRGIAAISIDVGAAFVWYNGEVSEQLAIEGLLGAHFDVLTRLNNGDALGLELPPLTDRLDLTNIALVGHSRSGEATFLLLEEGRDRPFEPRAAVLFQPGTPYELAPLLQVPMLLIRGGCDEDLGPDAGLDVFATIPDGGAIATDMLIPGAGHRMMNTNFVGSTCPGEIEPAAAQHQAGEAIASFLASSGEEIEITADAAAVVSTLGGPGTSTVAGPALDADASPVLQNTVSANEVLDPLPPGADYSSAFDEDF